MYMNMLFSLVAHPRTATFHYRHALRRLNQEYDKDPSLLEASLL